MRCSSCGGSAHPASGSQISESIIICGPCVRRFHAWVREHQAKRYRVGPRGRGARYIAFPY